MLKFKNIKTVDVGDWNRLVQDTYGKVYSFQQQDGCQSRGIFHISIPMEDYDCEEEMNDTISEKVNGNEIGVKFKVWLNRDAKQPIINQKYDWEINMFWERNFYPNIQTVANDLYKKGLIEKGDYNINIDW